MSEFLICQLCFMPKSKNLKIYITTCKHILCSKCIENPKKCQMCSASAKYILVGKDMPQSAREYLEPAANKIDTLLEINKFQTGLMDHIINSKSGILKKYEEEKEKVRKLDQHYKSLSAACAQEIDLIKTLEAKKNKLSPRLFPSSSPSSGSTESLVLSDQMSPLGNALRNINLGSSAKGRSASSRQSQKPEYSQRNPSPTDSIVESPDFLKNAKQGLYEHAYQSIASSNQKSRRDPNSLKSSRRSSSDIERARNVMF